MHDRSADELIMLRCRSNCSQRLKQQVSSIGKKSNELGLLMEAKKRQSAK